jgi:hypothetical protein
MTEEDFDELRDETERQPGAQNRTPRPLKLVQLRSAAVGKLAAASASNR